MGREEWDVLHFEERYYERVWGGHKLRTLYKKPVPENIRIGEAWLLSDHPGHETSISQGPLKGKTVQDLLRIDRLALLGTQARLTPGGRFPLLLKMLESAEDLSLQVHPDDDCAQRLREPESCKTEMWHVLHAEPGSELICGLHPGTNRHAFTEAVRNGSPERLLRRFPVCEGTTAFVSAGTVHAIGGGIVLAEIQQNSHLTYRIYDWGRLGTNGKPRELHLEKALAAISFGSSYGGEAAPLACPGQDSAQRTILAACRYFASDLVTCRGRYQRDTRGDSFHILLAKSGLLAVGVKRETHVLKAAEAVLVPGQYEAFSVEGHGEFLDYYFPDLRADVIDPLLSAGHSRDAITLLGGDREHSDLRI